MTSGAAIARNPFGATKAVDLNDSQIQSLWVDVLGVDDQLEQFAHPTSAMPSIVLGAKGSGKTHLMRYHSFELQLLRFGECVSPEAIQSGIRDDGYIGIYALCGSINSGRFSEKRQSVETWRALFAYYLELWLADHLLQIAAKLQISPAAESQVCADVYSLFDRPPRIAPSSFAELLDYLSKLRRELDYAVNNVIITQRIDVEILVTRGKLIFGIPQALARACDFLRDVRFVYAIDEFENLTIDQQTVVNSLIRDKQLPATFRVGSRLYGVKTLRIDGSDEENRENSEFEFIRLDRIFRAHKDGYNNFAKRLIAKRLGSTEGHSDVPVEELLHFASHDLRWESPYLLKVVKQAPSAERPHMRNFRAKLRGFSVDEENLLVSSLSSDSFPLLEKLNLLRFYKDVSPKKNPLEVASGISQECSRFIEGEQGGPYSNALSQYKSDLIAQLHRENGSRQYYLGLNTFISMSAGLPRALLTILRSILDWSVFQGEEPLLQRQVSIEAQYRGAREASDWFFENMRKAGNDGRAVQIAIDRLAQLFRVNRFADSPAEISLCTFAVPESAGTQSAQRILKLAEDRSLLLPVGGKDKNYGFPVRKFQLNPMLSPRWDLPTSRRGTKSLTEDELNVIFDPATEQQQFDDLLASWRRSMTVSTIARTGMEAQGDLL